jgi:hypothetical protein
MRKPKIWNGIESSQRIGSNTSASTASGHATANNKHQSTTNIKKRISFLLRSATAIIAKIETLRSVIGLQCVEAQARGLRPVACVRCYTTWPYLFHSARGRISDEETLSQRRRDAEKEQISSNSSPCRCVAVRVHFSWPCLEKVCPHSGDTATRTPIPRFVSAISASPRETFLALNGVVQPAQERVQVHRTRLAGGFFTTFESDQRGDAANAEARRERGIVIRVDLRKASPRA